ncbi:MAG TPA: sigma-70 family RNA polymerase sigma factor [Gemmataceae bacterium]|nr:sigma-70 family RNA polymerase sigma factor [Gemmataceae bacterium]
MAMQATTLGRVIRTAARQDRSPATDRELLRRFADGGDQDAFAALVRRHTGLVLGVCRRALANDQDAEDACQATFLILARKAGSGRWQSSIANWLFMTARRVAHDLRRTAKRRAKREGRAAVPESVPPVDRMTGRELLAVLDEELDHLPSIYREPLLLYYQADLSREEIAARLGLSAATVKIRLERGRKKLGDALTRRGVAMSAGLLTLLATSRAGASPPRLVDAIRALTAGEIPPAVAALARGVAVKGLTYRIVMSLAAAVAVTVVGIGLGTLKSTAGQPPERPGATAPDKGPAAKPAPDASKTVTFSGRVLDPSGKPQSGAKLVLLGWIGETKDLGTTGSDGRFKVQVPADLRPLDLVARADGVGIDFVELRRADPKEEIELHMVKDNAVRGRIVSSQGEPMAGVQVVAIEIHVYTNELLDDALADWKWKELRHGFPPGVKWRWHDVGVLPAATTDADGKFTLAGVGAERLVRLRVRGKGLAESEFTVVNRAGFDPKPYNEATTEKFARSPKEGQVFPLIWKRMLSGPDSTVIAEVEKPIRGVIKDAATGKPRAGVQVRLAREGRELLPFMLRATTDSEGRYEIHGARKAKSYFLEVDGDVTTRHLATELLADDTVGYEPVTANFATKKGVIVTGKVIDGGTKKPIPGIVEIGVLNDNAFVKDYPAFDGTSYTVTPDDGTFRVLTIPGRVLLMGGPDFRRLPDGEGARALYKQPAPDPNYPQYFHKDAPGRIYFGYRYGMIRGNSCKVLDIKADAEVVTQDIVVERVDK